MKVFSREMIQFDLPSLKLTANVPEKSENGWLEYELLSFLGRLGLFSGAFAVSFRDGDIFLNGLSPPTRIVLVLKF